MNEAPGAYVNMKKKQIQPNVEVMWLNGRAGYLHPAAPCSNAACSCSKRSGVNFINKFWRLKRQFFWCLNAKKFYFLFAISYTLFWHLNA